MIHNNATTYRALIEDAHRLLLEVSDTPRIDAEILLQHTVNRPLSWLIAYGDSHADGEHIKRFFTLVAERVAGKPVAYILGYREFWNVTLTVTPDVLIPRPDTETLVEQALQLMEVNRSYNILDLGTGSGAIALALAKERPLAQVIGVDACDKALLVAEQNAQTNQINNVRFQQSNWFETIANQQFDVIVSNPPYIKADDAHLNQGDLRFEPVSALTSGKDGLDDIRTIIKTSPHYLKENGYLLIEHGFDQASPVAKLLGTSGFHNIQLHHDLNQLPRCTIGQYLSSSHE